VADELRVKHILDLAHKQGLLKPSKDTNECWVDPVNTANYLLFLLRRADIQGFSTSQLINRSGLNKNTCLIYLRKLTNLGYLKKEKLAKEEAIWIYEGKAK
jgi:hypothetical protein